MADLRSRLPGYAPMALVLAIAAAGLLRVLMAHWRQGGVLLGAALLVAAVLRVALAPDQVGLLAVRSRVLDTLCYSALGVATLLLALTITGAQLTIS